MEGLHDRVSAAIAVLEDVKAKAVLGLEQCYAILDGLPAEKGSAARDPLVLEDREFAAMSRRERGRLVRDRIVAIVQENHDEDGDIHYTRVAAIYEERFGASQRPGSSGANNFVFYLLDDERIAWKGGGWYGMEMKAS